MLTVVMISLYSMLLAISVYCLVAYYKKQGRINAFVCLQVAFILYYIFIPLVATIVLELYPNELRGMSLRIHNANPSDKVYAFSYTVISYIVMILAYRIKLPPRTYSRTLATYPKKRPDNFKTIDKRVSNSKNYQRAITTGVVLLLLAVAAEYLVADSLGGFIRAVSMGDMLRAFGSDSSRYIPQSRLFAMTLMVASLASTYLFVYALRIRQRFIVMILLFASILASVFYLLINAGRIAILLFVLPFFIDYSFRKTRRPFLFMFCFSIVGILSLGALDDLFFYLSYGYVKESSSDIISIINEFAFPYVNLLNVHKINELYGLRWGIDFLTWIINIVPSSLLDVFGLTKVPTGYQLITEYYSGASASGGIPTDFLTLGMRQFGISGIVSITVLVSAFCNYFDKIIARVYSSDVIYMSIRIASIMFVFVPYADLDSFIRNRYDMILILLFALAVSRIEDYTTFNPSSAGLKPK